MKFYWLPFYEISLYISYKSPLFVAIQNENIKIVELLLSHPDIDVNYRNILNNHHLIQFKTKKF